MSVLTEPPAHGAAMYATIGWLYMVTHTARVVSYAPQLLAVYRCSDGARSVSLLTWCSWSLANLAALLYGCLVIQDLFFAFVSSSNFLCCTSVALLAAHRRQQWLKESLGHATDREGLDRL